MTRSLDHFIYAGRDLEQMRAGFNALTGVEANLGGRHPGLGTRNALASLGESIYFELLAADHEQRLEDNMGGRIKGFEVPRLLAYMIKAQDLEAVQQTLSRYGIDSDLFDAQRKTPDGRVLRWRLLVPRDDNPFGDHVPKFIDWLDTAHPATSSVGGCTFEFFRIGHPQAETLGKLLAELECEIELARSDRPYLQLGIGSPRGPVVLTSHS